MLNIKIPEQPYEERGIVRLSVPANKNLFGNAIKPAIKNTNLQNISLTAKTYGVCDTKPKKLNIQEQAIEAKYDLDDAVLFEIY